MGTRESCRSNQEDHTRNTQTARQNISTCMKILTLLVICLFSTTTTFSIENKRKQVAEYLQEISVTVRSVAKYSASEGSGAMINRKIEDENVTFVWTCAHVVDNLRKVRTIVGKHGVPKKLVEFGDVQIVKELVENGRRVGEIKMDAQVIKYSDADDGEDLALLMVRAKDYSKASIKFYLNSDYPIVPIGTSLFHVGSLLGQKGSNSMTAGIVSQVGRVLGGKVEYDQTTVTAFPGSSGGGVYTTDGEYVGMIVRGAGEGFNFMVPVRRMVRWAEDQSILWAIDPTVDAPTFEEIKQLPIEHSGDEIQKLPIDNDTNDFRIQLDRDFPHHVYKTVNGQPIKK